jgi:hypothetical protein
MTALRHCVCDFGWTKSGTRCRPTLLVNLIDLIGRLNSFEILYLKKIGKSKFIIIFAT